MRVNIEFLIKYIINNFLIISHSLFSMYIGIIDFKLHTEN